MKYTAGNADDIKHRFWQAMADSPFVMLQLDGDPSTAVPMTAKLDPDANSAIWFFTRTDSSFARLGAATATFAGKGHDVFARFHGHLSVETSTDRFDQFWSNFVEAWYDGGKKDPSILFLRMDLGKAEIWNGELGILNTARMALGLDVQDVDAGAHVKTAL